MQNTVAAAAEGWDGEMGKVVYPLRAFFHFSCFLERMHMVGVFLWVSLPRGSNRPPFRAISTINGTE